MARNILRFISLYFTLFGTLPLAAFALPLLRSHLAFQVFGIFLANEACMCECRMGSGHKIANCHDRLTLYLHLDFTIAIYRYICLHVCMNILKSSFNAAYAWDHTPRYWSAYIYSAFDKHLPFVCTYIYIGMYCTKADTNICTYTYVHIHVCIMS